MDKSIAYGALFAALLAGGAGAHVSEPTTGETGNTGTTTETTSTTTGNESNSTKDLNTTRNSPWDPRHEEKSPQPRTEPDATSLPDVQEGRE